MVEITEIRHGPVALYTMKLFINIIKVCFPVLYRYPGCAGNMICIHISKVTMFYMYIFTPIFFQNHKLLYIVISIYLININRVQVDIYGCVWMLMGTKVCNNDKMR